MALSSLEYLETLSSLPPGRRAAAMSDILAATIRNTEDRVVEVRKRAEEAVQEVSQESIEEVDLLSSSEAKAGLFKTRLRVCGLSNLFESETDSLQIENLSPQSVARALVVLVCSHVRTNVCFTSFRD